MIVDYDYMLKELNIEIGQADGKISAEKLAGNIVKEAQARGELTAFRLLLAWVERLKSQQAPEVVHLVCAQWDYEGSSDLAAFRDRASADAFVAMCDAYQETEPDDDEAGTDWENAHPGKPYLSVGDTLRGVESFVVIEITVL